MPGAPVGAIRTSAAFATVPRVPAMRAMSRPDSTPISEVQAPGRGERAERQAGRDLGGALAQHLGAVGEHLAHLRAAELAARVLRSLPFEVEVGGEAGREDVARDRG